MDKNITSNNIISTLADLAFIVREQGITHLYTDDETYNGRTITIENKKLINFGSCSYLGLDIDERLKQAAIDAIQRYGVQFSSSRSYVACTLYKEWEKLIRLMFNAPAVLTTSVSLGHHAVIPVIVEAGDMIIMDQQVHASVQDAALKMQLKGVAVTVVRHSHLEELESKITGYASRHNRIWYMFDGVYSMYGDFAPIKELIQLQGKYKQLHLYVDDAHGMSIAGLNGTGYILSQVSLHEKMILATSLNKAYAAGGGAFVFSNEALYQKVKYVAGPLIFSGPHQIPVIGAGIASAKIHLSPEIYKLQASLKEKLNYSYKLLKKYNLPVVSNPDSPISFIGLGLTRVSYNLVKRMMKDGFFVNLSIFPSVPEACSGLRFTITNHHTFEDINRLTERLAYHFPKALDDEGRTVRDVYRAFRRLVSIKEPEPLINKPANPSADKYIVQHETSIKEIAQKEWDELLGDRGNFDWKSLDFLEKTFKNNPLKEDNWNFHYYIIRDLEGKPILATFFTLAMVKDDVFAAASISYKIEQERISNPYYLCSTSFMMGALITEGQHLFLDRTRKDWKDILMLLLDTLWKEEEQVKADSFNLRDFEADDSEIAKFFIAQGFIKVPLPDTHIVENIHWDTKESFASRLNHSKRQYLKQKVLRFESGFDVTITNRSTYDKVKHWRQLYENVSNKSFEINGFKLPGSFFKNIAKHPNWEIIELMLKSSYTNKSVAIMLSYKTANRYCPVVVGIDYSYLAHNIYPQILWQTIVRANQLNLNLINWGLTSSQIKRKFGAKIHRKVAFVQRQDNYSMSLINAYSDTGKVTKD